MRSLAPFPLRIVYKISGFCSRLLTRNANFPYLHHVVKILVTGVIWKVSSIMGVRIWKDYHRRHLLPSVWSAKQSIISKLSCFVKQKKKLLFSSMTMQEYTLQNKPKVRSLGWEVLSPSFIPNRFITCRFSNASIVKTYHRRQNIQKQRSSKEIFETFSGKKKQISLHVKSKMCLQLLIRFSIIYI